MNSVVMPAATETTSCSDVTDGSISASSAPMSWGFTATMIVCAAFTAASLSTTSTPYRSANRSARSASREVTSRSAGEPPARISPDSNASPIFPAPRIAIAVRHAPPPQSPPSMARTPSMRLAGRSAMRRTR